MKRLGAGAVALVLALGCAASASAAEPAYPFIGSWIRTDRSCAASPARERIYTAKDVVSSRSKCSIRKVVSGSGEFELFERCERPNERSSNVRETIRMLGPDTMMLTRQTARLKLSRSLRFSRCPSVSSAPKLGR